MHKRLNLVFVTPFLPRRGFNAARTRIFEVIKGLSRGHNISVISFFDKKDEEYIDSLRGVCRRMDLVPFPLKTRSPFLRFEPGITADYRSAEMKERIYSLLRKEKFDVVQFEFLSMSQYLPDDSSVRSVLILHELGMLSLWRDMLFATRMPDRITAPPKLFKIAMYYRRLLGRFNKIIVFTRREREILCRFFPKLPVAVVPMGVDTDYFRQSRNSEEDIDLLYIGHFKHHPNIDAVYFFCRKILPLIRRRYPALRLSVAGRSIEDSLRTLEEEGYLHIIGEADDIRMYLERTKVFVTPIITGAGMRGKLLEALSSGKAVVSTSMGAEGIEAEDGEDLLIGDTPEEFARKVIILLEDSALRREIGINARRKVEAGFSWSDIAKRTIEEFL